MGKIHVINIHTTDCSNMKNYFYIGKSKNGNPLANPFSFSEKKRSRKNLIFGTREESVEAYRKYFKMAYNKPGFESLTKAFNEIYERYKNNEDVYLGCYCAPLPCHGDVLAEELQKKLIREKIAQKRIAEDC